LFSAILHQAYVEGIPNTRIGEALNIGERTLCRYKRKAIRVVAQLLREWEK
jgi:DNA-directed RNA polymerase specialized sigma subunit